MLHKNKREAKALAIQMGFVKSEPIKLQRVKAAHEFINDWIRKEITIRHMKENKIGFLIHRKSSEETWKIVSSGTIRDLR